MERASLDVLFRTIAAQGYTIVGPTVRDRTIVIDELSTPADLPAGWGDRQDGGMYRLEKRGDDALFGYSVGPESFKKFLFPPRSILWRGTRSGSDFEVSEREPDTARFAFVGVRPCDLHAIGIQDHVLLRGKYADLLYRSRRRNALIIVANCAEPGGTCFCVSMGTGPRAGRGFDLALTEIIENGRHYFTVETGSEHGEKVIAGVPHKDASKAEASASEAVTARAAGRMGRTLETSGIKELFYRSYEHPRWNQVEQRCLTCANCTMICPTCFCSTIEDTADLFDEHIERRRRWDSCFTTDFSYIVGGSIRLSTRSRYRQWITHKLATWIDQFGTSGCVGCGRCITWCPVGIDITEESRALREGTAAESAAVRETKTRLKAEE
ncbi:MAG: 4Fe-4S dicluster domain-containing protein [bacterium]